MLIQQVRHLMWTWINVNGNSIDLPVVDTSPCVDVSPDTLIPLDCTPMDMVLLSGQSGFLGMCPAKSKESCLIKKDLEAGASIMSVYLTVSCELLFGTGRRVKWRPNG